MNRTSQKLPPLRHNILLWDVERKDWYKAQLQENHGTNFWVIEPKIYFGVDNDRFLIWTELPERPQ